MSSSHREIDILHKDKERKEQRIDTLQKELGLLRKQLQEQQSENKLKHGVIETLYEDKKRLEKELAVYKDHHSQNTAKLSTLTESAKLHKASQEKTAVIKKKDEEISVLQGELILKGERIAVLEYELNVAYRAISVQNKFEQHSNIPNSLGVDKEALRTLYFTLAKTQADSQSVSQALAAATAELSSRQAALQTLQQQLAATQEENQHLCHRLESEASLTRCSQEELERLSAASVQQQFTVSSLTDAHKQAEANWAASKKYYEQALFDKDMELHELQEQVQGLTVSKAKAEDKLLSMEAAIDQLHYTLQHTIEAAERDAKRLRDELSAVEMRLSEYQQVDAINEQLQQKAQEMQHSLQQMEHFIENMKQIAQQAEEERNTLNYQLLAERAHSTALTSDAEQMQCSMSTACRERDEVVQALKQSMAITRDLMQQLGEQRRQKEEVQCALAEETEMRKKFSLAMADTYRPTQSTASTARSDEIKPNQGSSSVRSEIQQLREDLLSMQESMQAPPSSSNSSSSGDSLDRLQF